MKNSSSSSSRRDFIKRSTAASVAVVSSDLSGFSLRSETGNDPDSPQPWYLNITRWGQTNITEKDPPGYDIQWWRKHWKETHIKGVIINAGGIVAYYPSRIPLHRQAQYLEGKDLFGDLCKAAHEDGLAVFARMDSNRAHEEFYKAHPDWFAVNREGKPYKAGELYVTCINSPYYADHIPSILKEVSELYHPEGFTDNSWSGLGRDSICYCENCRKSFKEKTGEDLPAEKNWNNRSYRQWIKWSYERRIAIWELNNRTTRKAGGAQCIWSGMNSGSISNQARSFREMREICKRADIIMLDSQARSDSGGFQQNADMGKLIHGLLGWEKLVPESMAMYQAGRPTFRLAAKPVTEARMWMIEGIAGGIQPWWHYVSASHEDRRIYKTPAQLFAWHKENEKYLINRKPYATVGVVWSQENTDFYGRDDTETITELPYRGITQALLRARIPYIPVNINDIDRESVNLSALILPNIGIITDNQADSIRKFIKKGGGLFATGESSMYDEWGDRLDDYRLSDIYGAHLLEGKAKELRKNQSETSHTYLRLLPEMRSLYDGPKTNIVSRPGIRRHEVMNGFDETDIIAFGGTLQKIKTDGSAKILMTFIPEFPIYPPETAWMREPVTDIPGLIVTEQANMGRVIFMPADIDRQYARYNLPDHGNLIANISRWISRDNIPLKAEGHGMLDFSIYRQPGNLVVHIVNLTSAGTWRQPVDEYIPVGPVSVRIKLPDDVKGDSINLLVRKEKLSVKRENNWILFKIDSIPDHEIAVIS
jgi:hypothetical protein